MRQMGLFPALCGLLARRSLFGCGGLGSGAAQLAELLEAGRPGLVDGCHVDVDVVGAHVIDVPRGVVLAEDLGRHIRFKGRPRGAIVGLGAGSGVSGAGQALLLRCVARTVKSLSSAKPSTTSFIATPWASSMGFF